MKERKAWGNPRGEPKDVERWEAASREVSQMAAQVMGLGMQFKRAHALVRRLSSDEERALRVAVARERMA